MCIPWWYHACHMHSELDKYVSPCEQARRSSFLWIEEGAHSHLTCAVSRIYSLWSGATPRSGVARCIKKCIKQAWSEDEMKIMEGWWTSVEEKRCKVRRVTSILDVCPIFACKTRLYNSVYTFWNAWPIRVHERWLQSPFQRSKTFGCRWWWHGERMVWGWLGILIHILLGLQDFWQFRCLPCDNMWQYLIEEHSKLERAMHLDLSCSMFRVPNPIKTGDFKKIVKIVMVCPKYSM